MENNMDELLRAALSPVDMPEEHLNRQIMQKANRRKQTAGRSRENRFYSAESSAPSRRRNIFPSALAAVCVLVIFAVTLNGLVRNMIPLPQDSETQSTQPVSNRKQTIQMWNVLPEYITDSFLENITEDNMNFLTEPIESTRQVCVVHENDEFYYDNPPAGCTSIGELDFFSGEDFVLLPASSYYHNMGGVLEVDISFFAMTLNEDRTVTVIQHDATHAHEILLAEVYKQYLSITVDDLTITASAVEGAREVCTPDENGKITYAYPLFSDCGEYGTKDISILFQDQASGTTVIEGFCYSFEETDGGVQVELWINTFTLNEDGTVTTQCYKVNDPFFVEIDGLMWDTLNTLEEETDDTVDIQEEKPEETVDTQEEESNIAKQLDSESSTAEERYKINVFLSNFSEQWFNRDSGTGFDSSSIDSDQLVQFAYNWYALNSEESLEIRDDSYAALTFDQVNSTLDRYFGFTLTEDDFANSKFDIGNQTIVIPYDAGESYPNLSVASKITEIENGKYLVQFEIYALIDAMSGGNKVMDQELYTLTEDEASESSALIHHKSGHAIVRPYQENGIDSYQLVTYCLNSQDCICKYPSEFSELLLSPSEIGQFYSPGSVEAENNLLYYDEDVFGFINRMTWGCSTWCGCHEFYSNAEASSTLESQNGKSYSASNLTEFFRDSTWCEGVEGSGIGETVEIKQLYRGGGDDTFTFSEICIVNGYADDEEKWHANNRVRKLKVYYGDTYVATLLLEDIIMPQFFDISRLNLTIGNGDEATFRFEIADVYPGSTYDDTCITGILIEFTGAYAH